MYFIYRKTKSDITNNIGSKFNPIIIKLNVFVYLTCSSYANEITPKENNTTVVSNGKPKGNKKRLSSSSETIVKNTYTKFNKVSNNNIFFSFLKTFLK